MLEPEPQPEPAAPQETAELPTSNLIELSIYFHDGEVDQMDEDAAFLIRKGIISANGNSLAARIESLIRYATLSHVHRATQKMLQSDFEVMGQARRTLNELKALKAVYMQGTAKRIARAFANKPLGLGRLQLPDLFLQMHQIPNCATMLASKLNQQRPLLCLIALPYLTLHNRGKCSAQTSKPGTPWTPA